MNKIKTCKDCYYFNDCAALYSIDGEDEACQGHLVVGDEQEDR